MATCQKDMRQTGGNEREEKGIAWPDEELLEPRPIKNEPIFNLEELIG